MPDTATLIAFALVALGLVLSPGPNMMYLVSRSVTQGRMAGIVSLAGVAAGFVVWMVLAAVGLGAVLVAVPLAFELLKWAGAAYLLWLAWQAVRPGAPSMLHTGTGLPHDPPARLFAMGLVTNLLNPKVAALYVALFPQFLDQSRPDVTGQALVLGTVQIAISITVNLVVVLMAARVAALFRSRPGWIRVQRWVMGAVLAGLAVRLLLERRPA